MEHQSLILTPPPLRIDILPLREGHTLVIPKAHYSRVSELPAEYASAVGQAVTKVANGLTKGEAVRIVIQLGDDV